MLQDHEVPPRISDGIQDDRGDVSAVLPTAGVGQQRRTEHQDVCPPGEGELHLENVSI